MAANPPPQKKKSHVGRNVLLIIAALWIIGTVMQHTQSNATSSSPPTADTSTTTDTSSSPPSFEDAQATVKAEQPTIKVDGTTMARQYDANKITSEAYYKGRTVQVKGRVQDINQDILGSYYVSVVPVDPDYMGLVSMQCYVSGPQDVASISKDEIITVRGTVNDMSLGVIPFKDCSVVGTGA